MQFSAKQQGKMRCPLELRLARWHDIAGPNSKPLGRHATVPILQLRPWRPISNILSSTPSSCFSLTSTSAETIESCNGPVSHEKPPATSCSTQVPASIIRRQQTTSSVGASVWVSRLISASLVSSAPGLVPSSVLPPPPRRITGARLGYDHGLMERPLENSGRGAGCPCRRLLFPHVFGLDAYVVYLLLAGVNLAAKVRVPPRSPWWLTSVRQGPGVVIRKPSSPCCCQPR